MKYDNTIIIVNLIYRLLSLLEFINMLISLLFSPLFSLFLTTSRVRVLPFNTAVSINLQNILENPENPLRITLSSVFLTQFKLNYDLSMVYLAIKTTLNNDNYPDKFTEGLWELPKYNIFY